MTQSGEKSIVYNSLLANLPQLVVSFLYLLYNGLFTCMLQALEWTQQACMRKGLRVSSRPQGSQRTKYFLQVPYRYAIPLIVLSGLLHWLASQALYMINIEEYQSSSWNSSTADHLFSYEPIHQPDKDLVSCGFSLAAILAFTVLLGTLGILTMGAGLQRFQKNAPPITGSCSHLISASCHLPEGVTESNGFEMPLKWGLIRGKDDSCYGFTSGPVVEEVCSNP